MDSMDFLLDFHVLKDLRSKKGQKKRHSLKGMSSIWETNQLCFSPMRSFFNCILLNACSDTACEDRVLDSREAKGPRASP